jgi:cellulose synthase/poly-beta-1,6-N-acetylglucosamine synthase-like glycosyltransferase
MQIGLLAVVLINGFEMSEMLWPEGLKRRFFPLRHDADEGLRKVSIHLACCKEPPAMVVETLNSLAALDYPDFEVLVVDNNTHDPALWKPLRSTAPSSVPASASSTWRNGRATRRARSTSPSRTPPRTPASSPWWTPTTR